MRRRMWMFALGMTSLAASYGTMAVLPSAYPTVWARTAGTAVVQRLAGEETVKEATKAMEIRDEVQDASRSLQAAQTASADQDEPDAGLQLEKPVVRVLIIGASVAKGWRDEPSGGGYLDRAFRQLSLATGVQFDVYNHAIPGALVTDIADKYPQWLEAVRPDIVVIAWGTLNDAHAHTPMTVFRNQIEWEIEMALAHGARVMVVTPPVSKASYTAYRQLQPLYLQNEIQVAKSLYSPDVMVFNVFAQMKDYLADHGLTYKPFMADAWHPNAAGHELAGRLLANDLLGRVNRVLPPKVELAVRNLAAHGKADAGAKQAAKTTPGTGIRTARLRGDAGSTAHHPAEKQL